MVLESMGVADLLDLVGQHACLFSELPPPPDRRGDLASDRLRATLLL